MKRTPEQQKAWKARRKIQGEAPRYKCECGRLTKHDTAICGECRERRTRRGRDKLPGHDMVHVRPYVEQEQWFTTMLDELMEDMEDMAYRQDNKRALRGI